MGALAIPAVQAAIASAAVTAVGSGVVSHQQTVSQKRIQRQKETNQTKLQKEQQVSEKNQMEADRLAASNKSRLSQAAGQAVANKQLATKGIKAKPFGSFSDVTRSVLDEGTNA